MEMIKKTYVAPGIAVVETDNYLMEDWSERTEPFIKEHNPNESGITIDMDNEESGSRVNWLDYLDYNQQEKIKK